MSEGSTCLDNKTLETVVPAALAIIAGVWMVDGTFDTSKINLNKPPGLLLFGGAIFAMGWIYQAIDYQRQVDEASAQNPEAHDQYAWLAPILIMVFAMGIMMISHMTKDLKTRQLWSKIGGLGFAMVGSLA